MTRSGRRYSQFERYYYLYKQRRRNRSAVRAEAGVRRWQKTGDVSLFSRFRHFRRSNLPSIEFGRSQVR